MIKTEFFRTREDGVNLYRTYSDAGFVIEQTDTGVLYDEAVDVENSGHTYVETDTRVYVDDVEAQDALDILMGGRDDEI